MNLALELFVSSLLMIFAIVVVSEIGWKVLSYFRGDQ